MKSHEPSTESFDPISVPLWLCERKTGSNKALEQAAVYGETEMTDIPELTDKDFERAIPRRQRARLIRGDFQSGEDVLALRKFVGLTQEAFAKALGIGVYALRNWEQGRRFPEGPALALLRIAARHPRIIRENLADAA